MEADLGDGLAYQHGLKNITRQLRGCEPMA